MAAEDRRTIHYIYTGASIEALVQAVDPVWSGPLPHTVVIAPGGKVLFRHTGAVDADKLRDVVLQALGAFYQPSTLR